MLDQVNGGKKDSYSYCRFEAVSIFQLLCVAEFPLEDADQSFRIDLTMGRGGALIAARNAMLWA